MPDPPQTESEPEENSVWEVLLFFGRLALVGLFLIALVQVPLLIALLVSWNVSSLVGPLVGMAIAAGEYKFWEKYGPRPFPGLLQGCICIWGVFGIIGAFIGCAILEVVFLWDEFVKV